MSGKPSKLTLAERFWAKVDKGAELAPGGCWLWTAAAEPSGYGRFAVGKEIWVASRVAWFLSYGEIPADLFVCHRCDVPACVNPVHLFVGTQADNIHDAMAKGRNKTPRADMHRAQTGCKQGHPFDAENTYLHPTSGQRCCRACHRAWTIKRRRAA
jgi:hypothetical protein